MGLKATDKGSHAYFLRFFAGAGTDTPFMSALIRGLHSRWSPETIQSDEANARRVPTLHSPVRAAKIAAALRGKPRPASVIEAVRKANLGRKASAATRQKMSEAQKRRAPTPGISWTPEEDALLGTMTDEQAAERIGRSPETVSQRRYRIGVPAFVKRKPRSAPVTWTPAKDRLRGTMPDPAVARRLHCSLMAVFHRRRRLGIPAHGRA